MTSPIDQLPHKPPMRLVDELVEIQPGLARCRRRTRADDWFFQGHFPGEPVVPAIVLAELLAQTGGLAAGAASGNAAPLRLRVAALGPLKFPASAGPDMVLEASARCIGRLGRLYKIEGEVTADGVLVAEGSLTLGVAL